MNGDSLSTGNAERKQTKGEKLLEMIQAKTKRVVELNDVLISDTDTLRRKLNEIFGSQPQMTEKSPLQSGINVPREKGVLLEEVFYQLSSLEYEIERSGSLHTLLRDEIRRLDELI